MTGLGIEGARRFTPVPAEYELPFWEAASRGTLALQRCGDCGALVYPPAPECDRCLGTDLAYEPLSGEGTIYAAGIVRSPILPGLDEHLPVVCALVALAEDGDVLVATNIVGAPVEAARAGTPVRVCFDDLQPHSLPLFTPREISDA
jgi:uncharacterized OB-fold protein